MKYLLLSDIHGSLPRLNQVLRFYKKEHYDMLCIQGDILNYGPRNGVPEGLDAQGIVKALNEMADDIVAVRGNCDSEVDQMLLDFPIMQDYMLLVDQGHKLLLTHGHVYNAQHLPPGHFDAVIYGHTHLWELTPGEPLICNTGSITFPKQNREATFGTYADGEFCIRSLEGDVIRRAHI